MRRAAVGETLSHLLRLRAQGRAHADGGTPERWHAR
jgi:hypothetical protein